MTKLGADLASLSHFKVGMVVDLTRTDILGRGGRGDQYHAASDPPRTDRARNGIVSGLREWKDGIHLSDRGEDVTVC